MHFVDTPERAATLEIVADSLSDAQRITTLRSVLSDYAAHDAKARASVYLQRVLSFGFGELTVSDQIVVADASDAPGLLNALRMAFSRIDRARVRFAGELDVQDAERAAHLEDGQVWMIDDDEQWYACKTTWSGEPWPEAASTAAGDDIQESDESDERDEIDPACEVIEGTVTSRMGAPARYRAARSDASVGSIRRRIEAVFGLPEGSVNLCGPDGRALRADARIATLRRRWGV